MKINIIKGLYHTIEIVKEEVELTCKFGLIIVTTECNEVKKATTYIEIRKSLLWLDNLLVKDMDDKHLKNSLTMVSKCFGPYRQITNRTWKVLLEDELAYRKYIKAVYLLKSIYPKGTKITIQL